MVSKHTNRLTGRLNSYALPTGQLVTTIHCVMFRSRHLDASKIKTFTKTHVDRVAISVEELYDIFVKNSTKTRARRSPGFGRSVTWLNMERKRKRAAKKIYRYLDPTGTRKKKNSKRITHNTLQWRRRERKEMPFNGETKDCAHRDHTASLGGRPQSQITVRITSRASRSRSRTRNAQFTLGTFSVDRWP